jgi:hypothetical protein
MPTFPTPAAARKEQRAKEKEVREAIFLSQNTSALATLRKVAKAIPADQGHFKAGLQVRVRKKKKEVRLEANAPHSGVLEMGARPFWPPLQPLIEWARRKAADLGIVNLPEGKQFQGQASLTDDEGQAAESFARGVQRAIATRGLPARYPMRNQLPYAMKVLDRSFIQHLKRIAKTRSNTPGGQK